MNTGNVYPRSALTGCLLGAFGATLVCGVRAPAATVTGQSGVVASVYNNSFDPDEDFNPGEAGETTAHFGEPGTGTSGGWTEANTILDAVSRRDGRTFFGGNDAARLFRSDTTGTGAYLQYHTASPYTVGTVVTAHSNSFNAFSTDMPFTLQFHNGNLGQTTGDWGAVPVTASGPGTREKHPIRVVTGTGATADTMRIEFPSSSIFPTAGNSQAAFNEVVVLPDRLERISATVTSTSPGSNNMQGAVDQEAGNIGADIWYDQTSAAANDRFYVVALDNPTTPIAAMVLFGDGDPYAGQALRVRDSLGNIILNVAFDALGNGEIVPIKFDTPVVSPTLRFEWTTLAGASPAAVMREMVLLTAAAPIPEPAAGVLMLGVCASMGLLRGRRSR